jgi:hypothetical protein
MKLIRWFLKKINSPWYDRLNAEQCLIDYGIVPYDKDGWYYVNENKQIIAFVGFFDRQDSKFLFHCRFRTVYGDFQHHFVPFKNNHCYSCDQVITKLKLNKL